MLKNCEEEVVESLLNADLDCLSREALGVGVISQNVRDDLKSIDWDHVPRPRVIRYLLMHAYRAIEDSPKLYDQWLQVLSKHVASVEVLDETRQGHLLLMAPQVQVSGQTMRLAEGIGHDTMEMEDIMEMGEVFPAIGAKRPRSLNIFTEQHIPILIEKLAACAGKLSEISIVLGLPEHVRKDLLIMSITGSSIACFGWLLREWIVGKHSGAKDPTLENLEEVLRNQTVGLGGEANQLRSSLAQSGINFEVDEQQLTLPKKSRHESLPLKIVHQSSNAIVTEGKTTLLEVQAVTSHGANLSYQWLKDGCYLEDSKVYNNILCIKNADLSSSGEYVCKLYDGLNACSSRVITITVNISPDKPSKMVSLCPEVAALKNYEEEVVTSLLKADLDCLCREALEVGVIPKNVRDDVKSIDWDHVLRPRVIRYILMHAYRAIEDSPRLYEQWLQVVSKHVASVEVLDEIRQGHLLFMAPLQVQVSGQTMRLAEGTGFDIMETEEVFPANAEKPVRVAIGAKRPRSLNIFTEQHIPILTEKLAAACAGEWSGISIVLGLPEHIRHDLRVMSVTWSSMGCFNKLLWEWIVGKHSGAKDPTLENLEEVLRSQAVGLGGEANQLRSSLAQSGINFEVDEQQPTLPKKSRHESLPLKIVRQSSSAIVTEGKTTLLEVQAVTSHGASAKRPRTKNTFEERHVSILTEILATCAAKWNAISISLGLPEHVRTDLRLVHDSIACFNKVLWEWIVGNHAHAKDPTLENLEEALKSPMVGLGSEANHLCGNLTQKGLFVTDEQPTPRKKPRLQVSPLEIVSQSCDTVVTEGKSTLLEVQAASLCDSNIVSYLWLKDGRRFEKSNQFRNNILCVNDSSLSSKGTYTCQLSDGLYTCTSRPIHLTVDISSLTRVLVDRYSSQPEVPEDSWPPSGANTYINLALIKPGNIEKAGEYARSTIQGNIDDIMTDKESIEYDMVFTNLESAARLLIEGRPGSGKTTLVHRFSKDWASGKLNMRNIKLLFLVHLRGFFNNPHITLRDIIKLYYPDESMVDVITHEAEESSGEGLCFILDGLDEYRPKLKNTTFIFKLIKRLHLPNAVVIIASRPAASFQLRKMADKNIEVIGFLKAQVYEYVEKYPFIATDNGKDLRKYLEQHPNVHHMCYLPIHAAMVCYLFNIMDGALPRTETEMYTDFTTLTLLRTIRRKEDDEEMADAIRSAEDLPEDEKKLFLKICKLGFEKTVSSKQVMRKDEVSDFFKDVHCGNESMGLITADCISRKCGFENLYTFLHLTFQEYLAAYHVFKLSDTEQLKLLRKYGNKRHMQMVWKFYCGLTSFEEKDVKFHEIMKSADKDDLFGVQCAFESQQSTTCDSVVQSGEYGTLTFQGHFLTPSDLTAIGYVLKKSPCPVEKLVMDRCKLGMEGLNAFLDEAGDRILSVKALGFHGKAFVMEQYELLNFCLQKMASIEEFDLTNANFGSRKLNKLTSNSVTLPNLRTLKVSTLDHITKRLLFNSNKVEQIVFCDYGMNTSISSIKKHFLKVFSRSEAAFFNSVSRLVKVDLKNTDLQEFEVKLIAEGLKQQACCTSLDLTDCSIGDGGCEDLANGLMECSDLRELFLCKNKIGDRGARAVAELFHTSCQGGSTTGKPFLKVDMSYNHIGDSGALSLAESLKNLTHLKKLKLKCNKIGDKGAIAITRAIMGKDCLLQIWNHRITENGSRVIVDLKPDADDKFHVLNISSSKEAEILLLNMQDNVAECNSIKDVIFDIGKYNEGLSDTVAAIMKCCHKIQMLEILCTSKASFMAIALSLEHCKYLQTLDLKKNDIGADGAKALAEGLQHCNNLQTLHLDENNIDAYGAKALAESLQHCSNLHTLHLDRNNIGADGAKALAEGLQHCNNLQALYLDENNIGADGAKALAEGLQHCNNLQALYLDQNGIGADGAKALAEGLQHCNNLQALYLDQNGIGADGAKALAEGLQHCSNLQTLHLDENNIDAYGAKALAESLQHCSNLHTLHLDRNNIGADGAKALAEGLQHCNNLQALYLDENNIGADGAKALAEGLQHCNNLQALYLDQNGIGADGAKAFAEGLQHWNNLQTLHLEGNGIGADGAKALAEGLQYCNNLQTLHLEGNGIGADGVKALAKGLQHCSNLHTLHLDRNNIGADGAKALAEGLQHCNNLQALYLDDNGIGADGVKALAKGLQHCSNLHTLHLDRNNIGADGAKALAEGLQHCNNLQALYLDDNGIGADGAKALAEGLQHWNNLQTLNLDWNDIGADGAKALAEGLQHCNNLQTLYLEWNGIGADGAKALAEGLQHWNNLQTLYLEWNGIGGDGAKALAEGLQHCSNLQTLHLEGNDIGADGTKALAEGLQYRNNLRTLGLELNDIGADGAKALAEGLQHCNNLQTLHLEGNGISADGTKALAEGLQYRKNLRTLGLELNDIGADGAKALAEGLQHCNNLQTLYLDENFIGADGAKALAEGLQYCNNLQTLYLDGNFIGADGTKPLAEGLQHCNNLQTLHLDQNGISADGAKALADGLQHCNNLQALHLKENEIGADGTKALAEGLQHCNKLETLHLDWNHIGNNGTKALAEGLQHCNSLQTLNLEGNNIGDDGAKALAECLQHCNKLQTLHLEGNNISADGAKGLAEGLQHCNNLHTLDLEGNGIGVDDAKAGVQCLNPQALYTGDMDTSLGISTFLYPNKVATTRHWAASHSLSCEFVAPLQDVPFVEEISSYTCDDRGATLSIHDITVTIPPGAIPDEVTAHIEMGVALYGPFKFPDNCQPVSPILWFCIQEDIELLLPLTFRLPHVIADLSQANITFAKTNHITYQDSAKRDVFTFERVSNGELDFAKESGYGILSSKHCCFLCLNAEITKDLALEKGYCLHILIENRSPASYRILLIFTYFLKTCFEVCHN